MTYFEKYNIKIEAFETEQSKGINYFGDPEETNGLLIEILSSRFSNEISLELENGNTLNTEVDLIKYICDNEGQNLRYPLAAETGQICIYKDQAYIYDLKTGYSVIGEFDTLSNVYTIPSEDLLGILKEFIEWQTNEYPLIINSARKQEEVENENDKLFNGYFVSAPVPYIEYHGGAKIQENHFTGYRFYPKNIIAKRFKINANEYTTADFDSVKYKGSYKLYEKTVEFTFPLGKNNFETEVFTVLDPNTILDKDLKEYKFKSWDLPSKDNV